MIDTVNVVSFSNQDVYSIQRFASFDNAKAAEQCFERWVKDEDRHACINSALLDGYIEVNGKTIIITHSTENEYTELERMIKNHDMFYSFSDDHKAYMKGLDEKNAILALAKKLDHDKAIEIWNKVCRSKEMPSRFYWTTSTLLELSYRR